MSEATKTITFVVAALLLAGAAYVVQPRPEVVDSVGELDEVLFAGFDDPTRAAKMEIVRYDEALGEIHTFTVAKDSRTGVWSIPSHDNYPADAEQQMQDAALSLVGLRRLGIASEDATDHELYGVREPDPETTRLGDRGVGTLVSFSDARGDELAELVIGKEVRDAEGQRFVRRPGQDVVYVVAVDPSKLSTSFQDWIEEDLLQLNAFDVEALRMKDYSIVQTLTGPQLELRSDASVDWNATDSKWELDRLVTYRGAQEVPTELLPGEELNTEKLNDAKNALADLTIVDVRRKPSGLGADLKADTSFVDNPEYQQNLMALGFYTGRTPDGSLELLSANGEIHAATKDGYEYVLRFGGVTSSTDEEAGLNRYLFVTTRVIEDRFPPPVLEDLPPELSEGGSAAAETGEPGDAARANEPPADSGAADEEAETEDTLDKDEVARQRAAERERIETENQRKLDEWEENKKAAEDKVRELNGRFADWYYVISDDVYRQIHLTRSAIIRESETAAEEGFGVDAFRQLQQEGIEGIDTSTTTPPPPLTPTFP